VDISWNAPGCNPSEEVLVACEVVGIENYFRPNGQVQLTINPNPFTRQTILEFTLRERAGVSGHLQPAWRKSGCAGG
jgi:hypothetical protein